MFVEPARTNFDLNFGMFGFRIRVHPLFWLASALFGSSILDGYGPKFFLAWIAVVFLSILVHELGHAFAFRRFGTDSHIVMHAFGGLAIPSYRVRTRGRRILVSLAGPFAGFLLFGVVYGLDKATHWSDQTLMTTWLYRQLVFVNVAWGCLNLLPVWPLDGGHISEEICSQFSRHDGLTLALKISIAVASAMAAYSLVCAMAIRQRAAWIFEMPWWSLGSLWTAILFALLAVQSYQLLQQVKWQGSHWDRP